MKSEKITELGLERRRSYADACATAHALDLLGERWALLVMRELMTGPKRFGQIRAGLPGISANVLTQRLEGLEASGVVIRRQLPPPAATQVYELTEWGYESEPIFQALGRWAARSPHHDPTLPFSTASLILSLRTMFDTNCAATSTMRIALTVRAEHYLARVEHGVLTVTSAPAGDADATLAGAAPAIAAVIYGGQPLADLEAAGALRATGDRSVIERFATFFPLPLKVTTLDAETKQTPPF